MNASISNLAHSPRSTDRLPSKDDMADPDAEKSTVDGTLGSRTPTMVTSSSDERIPGITARNEQVGQLARTFSRNSIARAPQGANLFRTDEPALDPSSPEFDAKRWATELLHAFSHDPEKYARHTVGVSYCNLGVYGFGRPTDYQKDVLNVLARAPLMARDLLSKRGTKIQILRDFEGVVKRGEMLLVLGRPGRSVPGFLLELTSTVLIANDASRSGVSTLLKTIAGQTRGLYLDEGSQFNYQGVPWEMMHKHFRGEVIYQAETDVHFPQLTVGETLLFSALARTPKNRLPGVSRMMYAEHLRNVVMAMFGISHTVNTKVGNDFIRGVSGGERKRVSVAEVCLSQSGLQCWDNSTRGLDSATALEFVKILRLSTELGETAAVVAMYQASQPAYDVSVPLGTVFSFASRLIIIRSLTRSLFSTKADRSTLDTRMTR